MVELIDIIWCKIIILINHLPVYKIIFFTYFLLPVVGISFITLEIFNRIHFFVICSTMHMDNTVNNMDEVPC